MLALEVRHLDEGVGISGRQVRVNGEGEGGWIWCMFFVFVYENRTMKPIEIVLRKGRSGDEGEWWGVNLIKIDCKYICKCCNVSPYATIIW
jgi:hypothetical protein